MCESEASHNEIELFDNKQLICSEISINISVRSPPSKPHPTIYRIYYCTKCYFDSILCELHWMWLYTK